MKKISMYRIAILTLLVFSVVSLELKASEPLIYLLATTPFLIALALSFFSGFSTQPTRIVAFSAPSLLFFFYAIYPWLVRKNEVVTSTVTSVVDFIHYPITACVLGFACLALFEIFTAMVSMRVDNS